LLLPLSVTIPYYEKYRRGVFRNQKTYKKEPNEEEDEEGDKDESKPGKTSKAGIVPCVAFAEAR
jgi:hypothetical protein